MARAHTRTARGALVLGICATLLGTQLLGAPVTGATPERIAQIEAELEALGQEQAFANEQVLTAQYEYDRVNDSIARTEGKIDEAKGELRVIQESIGRYAAAAYRTGGIDSSLQLLLADDPQEFLDSAVVLDIVASSQNVALRKGQVARLKLAQASAELAQQKATAATILADMESYKAALDEKVAETEAYLAQLEEEERERLAEERRRREAAQRAAAEAARQGNSGSTGGSSGGYTGATGPTSERAAIAVAYALAQVGEPYVNTPPGARPPDSWDCSKLTAAAWAQAGIYLTPYSAAQINEVRTISQSELRPGDLLFYYNPSWGRVGHVSMYIGGGMVVEASTPSTGVRIHPVYWGNFVKAGRPAG